MTSPQAGGLANPFMSPLKVGMGWSLRETELVQRPEVENEYRVGKNMYEAPPPSPQGPFAEIQPSV